MRLGSRPKRRADFIEPMDCAAVTKLADGPGWVYEIKLDGYRAIAVKADGRVNLFSRRRKSFDHHYPLIVEALAELPEGTVVDGEIVALDDSGKPDFNLLQNFRSEAQHIHYFIFDLLVFQDRDLTKLTLSKRRELMKSNLKIKSGRVRIAEQFEAKAADMLAAVRGQQLEGVIGKRKDSLYESGKRSGSWVKCRVNRGQELVIGGYIPGPHGFDSLIVGYYKGKDLMYVARVRNGFVPASRRQVFEKIRHLESPTMPFANLPDTHKSRWGDELTAEKIEWWCLTIQMNLLRRTGFLVVALVFAAFALHELRHFYRFGHFVPLGLHADAAVTTSNELLGVEGSGKIYHASLTNYGLLPAAVTVCDYLDWTSGHQTMVNYIVERRTQQIGKWEFVPEWDDYGSRLFCRPSFEVTETHLVRRRLWLGQTYRIGEGVPAQWGGFHIGDEGRFTVFLNADNDKSGSISTAIFRVDQEVKRRRDLSPSKPAYLPSSYWNEPSRWISIIRCFVD